MAAASDPYAAFRLNLEQQRKRAKDLLHAIRAGDRGARSRLRAACGDRVAPGDAKLADAQFVVARELGLDSWPDLRRHIDALSTARAAMEHGTAPDAGAPTLHVRCGSDIQQALHRAGFRGDFLSLWDPFTVGPITSSTDWLERRARFLAGGPLAVPYEELLRELTTTDEQLSASAGRYARVVLWMEHDSHDQLSLVRCLARYARVGPPAALELISIDHFPGSRRFIGLGQLPPEAMRLLWRRRLPIRASELTLAANVWDALCSDDPRPLATLAQTTPEGLPHLGPALLRHLRELPSLANGLSLTQHLILQMLDEGPMTIGDLFWKLHAEREPLPFLADTTCVSICAVMERAALPVFTRVPGDRPPRDRLSMTETGREVLRGATDWLSLQPPPRWVGGVRIDAGSATWRWDEAHQAVVRR